MLHREQSFGEIRGLQRLSNVISDRKLELQRKLGLVKELNPLNLDGHDTDQLSGIDRE
jgi:hypothetical protein